MATSSLDFVMYCSGVGVLLVCIAFSIKIVSETFKRTPTNPPSNDRLVAFKPDPIDPMEQKLNEIRKAQFGRPMDPAAVQRTPPQTWPALKRRSPVMKNKPNE